MARAHSTAGSKSSFSGYDLDLDRAIKLYPKERGAPGGPAGPRGAEEGNARAGSTHRGEDGSRGHHLRRSLLRGLRCRHAAGPGGGPDAPSGPCTA